MLNYEDTQRLKGMKHIKYTNTDQDQAWQFMLRITEELLAANIKLRQQNDDLRKGKDSDATNEA